MQTTHSVTDEMRRMDIMRDRFYSHLLLLLLLLLVVPDGLLFLCAVLVALILIKVFLQVQEPLTPNE